MNSLLNKQRTATTVRRNRSQLARNSGVHYAPGRIAFVPRPRADATTVTADNQIVTVDRV